MFCFVLNQGCSVSSVFLYRNKRVQEEGPQEAELVEFPLNAAAKPAAQPKKASEAYGC